MAVFVAYKYEFMHSQTEGSLFDTEAGEKVSEETVRFKWSSFLNPKSDLRLYRKVNGEIQAANAWVVANKNDIVILTVHNVKNLEQWKYMASEPEKLLSYPHCKVIIDNRKGVQQILVERSEAFNYNPETARKMLEKCMNDFAIELRYTVKFFGKYVAKDTWKVVEEQRQNGHPVISISFSIGSRAQADIDEDDICKAAVWWNGLTGAAFSTITTHAKSKGELAFMEASEDCRRIVQILANNGYNLTVRFRGGGVHKSNSQVTALFEMPQEADFDFINGQLAFGGKSKLVDWLDDIRNPSKYSYKDVEIHSERGRAAS